MAMEGVGATINRGGLIGEVVSIMKLRSMKQLILVILANSS
jgi:hypothetical protein